MEETSQDLFGNLFEDFDQEVEDWHACEKPEPTRAIQPEEQQRQSTISSIATLLIPSLNKKLALKKAKAILDSHIAMGTTPHNLRIHTTPQALPMGLKHSTSFIMKHLTRREMAHKEVLKLWHEHVSGCLMEAVILCDMTLVNEINKLGDPLKSDEKLLDQIRAAAQMLVSVS